MACFVPMPGTQITRFSLESVWENPIHLYFSLCESVVSITIRSNEWPVDNFPDVVLLKLRFFFVLESNFFLRSPSHLEISIECAADNPAILHSRPVREL